MYHSIIVNLCTVYELRGPKGDNFDVLFYKYICENCENNGQLQKRSHQWLRH